MLSTCAFPFGGNRNWIQSIIEFSWMLRLHVPSRLDGIETELLSEMS